MTDNARFTMYRGDTKILNVAVTDGSGVNVPIDDATSVTFGLFDKVSLAAVLVKELLDGVTVAGNIATVTILAADSAALLGEYPFEMEVIDASGYTFTVLRGTATVKEDLITPTSVP